MEYFEETIMIVVHMKATSPILLRRHNCAQLLGRAIRVALFAGAAMIHLPTHAETIVVGSSGEAAGCNEASLQAAIHRAARIGGHNTILLTDDIAGGVWHENAQMGKMNPRSALEIVGGFNSCADLAPNGGRTRISGAVRDMPVIKIVGRADISLRNVSIEGGSSIDESDRSSGILFRGRGQLKLASVTVANHADAGIEIAGNDGEARLELTGSVDIADNRTSGIEARDRSVLTIRGNANTIQGNSKGIQLLSPAVADIGATGDLIVNNGVGIVVRGGYSDLARTTRVYSTDPSNPLAIAGNMLGGIVLDASSSPYRLCLKNVALVENESAAIFASGRGSRLDINTACRYPAEAAISCPPDRQDGECNLVSGNSGVAGQPLIEAVYGARVAIDRTRIRSTSVAPTQADGVAATDGRSSINVTNSVVAQNDGSNPGFASFDQGRADVRAPLVIRHRRY